MTEEQLHKQTKQLELKASADNNRRRLIKGAAATIPVIMTLYSGSALAVSSNLVTKTDSAHAVKQLDGESRQVISCFHPESGPVDGVYDLGDPVFEPIPEQYVGPDDLILTKEQLAESLRQQGVNCEEDNLGIMITTSAWGSLTGVNVGQDF